MRTKSGKSQHAFASGLQTRARWILDSGLNQCTLDPEFNPETGVQSFSFAL
jgi:hypothetical protein